MNLDNLARVIRQTVANQGVRYTDAIIEKEIIRLIEEELVDPHPAKETPEEPTIGTVVVTRAKRTRSYPAKKAVKKRGSLKRKK